MQVIINNKIFEVHLEDNMTAKTFIEILPQKLQMIELNGNEKYCYLEKSLPQDATCPKIINEGDIMLWGDKCIVLFYKKFKTRYIYTKIGKIIDTGTLKKCLGQTNVEVNFVNKGEN